MNGPAWPLSPVLGQVFKGWAYDGRQWRKARGAEWSNIQKFTAVGSAIYYPSPDLIYCVVECFGAGGGGGWAQRPSAAVSGYAAAGGGGSGGYSRKTLPAELVANGVAVYVAPGLYVSVGMPGGGFAPDTTFGTFCVAKGGQNGNPMDGSGVTGAAFQFGQPGGGAPAGTGDLTMPGACGAPPIPFAQWQTSGTPTLFAQAGVGGCLFGGNVQVSDEDTGQSSQGANGLPNTGAGGNGGQSAAAGLVLGGTGGSGMILVSEVCGTENGGGVTPPIEPPPGWPPGVPFRVDVKAAVKQLPPGAEFPPFPKRRK